MALGATCTDTDAAHGFARSTSDSLQRREITHAPSASTV